MSNSTYPALTRRQLLKAGTLVSGGVLLFDLPAFASPFRTAAQQRGAPADPLAATRAQLGAAPIESTKLADNLTLLSGPGGNVVVLHGTDGKTVVDTFVLPVWPKLKAAVDGLDATPIKLVINTHWHFDHTDNNASFHEAGAAILAHENTKKRLTESHDLLGMHFNPAPAAALPTQTFTSTYKLQANGETIELAYIPPAHTDTDISIHYTKANVLHLGDVFFNGMYPFMDAGTGGHINGTIAAVDRALKTVDAKTRIVPGHGPLADRAALTRYHDVLVTIRDRVKQLKSSGKRLEEVVAAKPTAEFDATWGKGIMMPNDFVALVYNTL